MNGDRYPGTTNPAVERRFKALRIELQSVIARTVSTASAGAERRSIVVSEDLSAHLAAPDPHPQYATDIDVDGVIAALAALALLDLVVGPASVTADRLAVFDGATGKLLKEATVGEAGLATAAQGTLADSAVQPGDPVEVNAQVGTTYTLVLADAGKLVSLDNGAAITLTVPTNAAVALAVGTVITLQQMGVGAVSVVGSVGVTINGVAPGAEALTAGQYTTTAALRKVSADVWTLTGAVV